MAQLEQTQSYGLSHFASSIAQRKVSPCLLCSYIGDIWLRSEQWNMGSCNMSLYKAFFRFLFLFFKKLFLLVWLVSEKGNQFGLINHFGPSSYSTFLFWRWTWEPHILDGKSVRQIHTGSLGLQVEGCLPSRRAESPASDCMQQDNEHFVKPLRYQGLFVTTV